MRCWSWPRRSWPRRSPPPMTPRLPGRRARRHRRHRQRQAARRCRGRCRDAQLPSAAAGGPGGPGAVSRRGRPGHLRDHGADDRLLRRRGAGCCTTAPGSCWTLAVGAGGRTRRCAGRPENGTSAGAGSRAVSPAGSTCTTSSSGANGGRTNLDNLISFCKYHHMLVHERGYLIAAARDGTLRLLPARRRGHPAQSAAAAARGHDRGLPRRRDHRGYDHPAVVRRAARPGPRHLRLPGQRPHRAGAAGTAASR